MGRLRSWDYYGCVWVNEYNSVIPGRESPGAPLIAGCDDFFSLDEASGNRIGNLSSVVLTDNGGVASVAGKIGNAASFTAGSSQYLSNAVWDLRGRPFMSVSAWTRQGAHSVGNYVGLLNVLGNPPGATWRYSDRAAFFYVDNVVFGITPANVISGTGWHHIVFVYNGALSGDVNRLKCWVDGAQQALSFSGGSVPSVMGSVAQGVQVGRHSGASYADGDIDLLGSWNNALTETQVLTLFNAGAGYVLT